MAKEQPEFLESLDPTQASSSRPQQYPEVLSPKDYLEWLLSLERAKNLPDGVRAYLVYKGVDRGYTMRPVGTDDSVLNLRTELAKHLRGEPYEPEFFEQLRDICEDELIRMGRMKSRPVSQRRVDLALEASYEMNSAAEVVLAQMEPATGDRPLRTLLKRIMELACAQMSALGDDLEPEDHIAEIVEH